MEFYLPVTSKPSSKIDVAMKALLIFLYISHIVCDEQKNVFPYLSELEDLFSLEERLIYRLEEYTESLEANINFMEKTLQQVNEAHRQNSKEEEEHPFASYRLMTRFTDDWLQIEELSKQSFSLLTEIDKIPSNEEYLGTLFVLAKLQNEYNLSTSDLVKGKIGDIQTNAWFTWEETLSFGYELYRGGLSNQSKSWLREGMNRFFEKGLTDINLVDSIRQIADHIGDTDLSNNLKEIMLKQDPSFEFKVVSNKPLEDVPYVDTIEDKLCRGEELIIHHNQSCSYVHYNNPYLLIGPHKLETLHKEPFIGMIHDVISDLEIAEIETNSRGQLRRSMVLGPTKDVFTYHKGRTSTSCHLNEGRLLDKLHLRMKAMTNLEIVRFPDDYFTVTNYGIGSFYKTHHDFFSKDINEEKGNRIATIMFYLSNVDVGGSTVFPNLRLHVKPQKGSALVWFNLKKSGVPNPVMSHAACSLVMGEKLIATYWVNERGNEFNQPCGLGEDDLMHLF